MHKTRFLMIGGFLGAGKTTAIARLAQYYTDQGLRVGVVTNDQAYGLVDTHTLRSRGFHVGEVPGACFCCKFDELVETVTALGAEQQPDLILTEPVGSCTDLVATVLQPLSHLFGDRYTLSPLTVLCKPEHGRKILGGGSGGFSPQAAYIFSKQLEEADVVALNKIDRLTAARQAELIELLKERFPSKKVLATSGVTGAGYAELIAALAADAPPRDQGLEIDYDTYASGEAALGWLNAAVHFTSSAQTWPLDTLTVELVSKFRQLAAATNMEPGHVKVLASAGTATAVANWVASEAPVELSIVSNATVSAADVLVNVRVHGDPEELAELARRSIVAVAQQHGLDYKLSSWQHFRPGRPEPVHRYATPAG
ncbi:MAG: cobalamin biosynthesis protein P47K [Pirellulales bacterium]|nr:cobalamin biosynthesis protein P47K [Pirellulales bacterium]